jgi:hypothetical protein
MELDRWTLFNLPESDRQLLEQYGVPQDETAVLKGLPIQVLDLVKPTIRRIAGLTDRKMRVIYRGPRYDLTRGWCRKSDARAFSVYFR